jgi:ribonuclease P/MRP protein subunit POP7
VRKYLSAIERRALGDLDLGSTADRDIVTALGAGGSGGAAAGEGKRGEVVTVKATGRAIEKALRVAVWFQGQADTGVRLRTGTVGAVDDLEGEEGEGGSRVRRLPVLEVGVWLK